MANQQHVEIIRQGVKSWNTHVERNREVRANLSGAYLVGASLSHAWLNWADLRKVNLREADLSAADLVGADLSGADLRAVNLSSANLRQANLSDANLTGADLSHAVIKWTIFANNDLTAVKGLTSVRHAGPSTLGIDTLLRSDGVIPEVFLRGVGLPESFITYLPSALVEAADPVLFMLY